MSFIKDIVVELVQLSFTVVKKLLPAPKWKKEFADFKEDYTAFKIEMYEKELHRAEKSYIKIKAEIQKHEPIVPDHLLEEKYRGKTEINRLKEILKALKNYVDPDEDEENN